MPNPSFSGDPKAEWLSETGFDRRMRLLEPFWFRDRADKRWDAAAGSVIDGASIPKALWALVGSPYTGEYRRASIVHDIACVEADGDQGKRRLADKMFFAACRAGGCSRWEATVLYVGVRIGAWASLYEPLEGERQIKIQCDSADRQIQEDFRTACELVLRQGETDDADIVHERTEAALQAVAAVRLVSLDRTQRMASMAGPGRMK